MITFENVNKSYNDFEVLKDINFTIKKNSIFGILGKSGAGKSTLLRTINKLEDINSGRIIVDGIDINTIDKKELREYKKQTAMIFQNFSLLETKTVFKNISLPLECSKYSKIQINKRVEKVSKLVGIEDLLKRRPKSLSGGQKQRVAIARALVLEPKILLCDEATSALDPITTKQILLLLKTINKELGITIVIVTHQMEVVKEICDEIIIMDKSSIIDIGKTNDLFLSNNQALKTIIEEDEILPESGINIKLFFNKNCTKEALITKMARDLDIDFSIVFGKLEKFKDDILGSLIINIKEENIKSIIEYIKKYNVNYQVIGSDKYE